MLVMTNKVFGSYHSWKQANPSLPPHWVSPINAISANQSMSFSPNRYSPQQSLNFQSYALNSTSQLISGKPIRGLSILERLTGLLEEDRDEVGQYSYRLFFILSINRKCNRVVPILLSAYNKNIQLIYAQLPSTNNSSKKSKPHLVRTPSLDHNINAFSSQGPKNAHIVLVHKNTLKQCVIVRNQSEQRTKVLQRPINSRTVLQEDQHRPRFGRWESKMVSKIVESGKYQKLVKLLI